MYSGEIADKIVIVEGDLSDQLMTLIYNKCLIGIDIETSGLDWDSDEIGTIQISIPSFLNVIIQINDTYPSNLIQVFEDIEVKKIFHHALFDIRFVMRKWGNRFDNIFCTKISSKLIRTNQNNRLVDLLNLYLGVSISKNQQTSDWLKKNLTESQIRYASNDVKYLPELYHIMREELHKTGKSDIAKACFGFLPIKALLDIEGFSDIFEY